MTVPAAAHDDSAHGSPTSLDALKAAAANGTAAALMAPATPCGPRPTEEPLQPGTDKYQLHKPVSEIHAHDVGTQDAWIPRWVQACVPGPPRPVPAS